MLGSNRQQALRLSSMRVLIVASPSYGTPHAVRVAKNCRRLSPPRVFVKKINEKRTSEKSSDEKNPQKNGRKNSEKNWTKKFRKNLDEKIPKKFVIVSVN